MRGCIATLLLGALAVTAQQNQAQLPADPGRAIQLSREVASRSLQTLSKLVTESNFRSMGFQSLAEVRAASLGEPIVSFFVQLDELRQYKPEADPLSLLKGGDLVLYPIEVNQQPRSIVEVTRQPNAWAASGFGGAQFSRLLHRFRAQKAAETRQPVSSFFELRVPALRAHFLGVRSGSELMLVPLVDDPKGRWRAGASIPARQVFAQLVADAVEYNGLPM